MNTLHNGSMKSERLVPKEGQRDLLCSNKASLRCPSFGINNQFISEDDALDYLAEVLVGAFLDHKRNANTTIKTSGDLLPSINKGAS